MRSVDLAAFVSIDGNLAPALARHEPMPRQFRNRRETAQLSVNLTPLLDVILQLITFFMMLIHFGTKLEGSTADVKLPVTPAALPGSDLALDRLTVAIDSRGRLLAEEKTLDLEAAETWWTEQAAERRKGLEALGQGGGAIEDLPTVVIVRADRSVAYGTVRRTLTSAQRKGFAHFSLVVLRSEQP
jgi:biopolymer transport protein ExbD